MRVHEYTRGDLIAIALRSGVRCGECYEAHLGPSGEVHLIGIGPTADFVCNYQDGLGPVSPLKCRVYLAIVHTDGAYMVEL